MAETPETPEMNYDAPVSAADTPMLAEFGVVLPCADNEAWLEEFNRKVVWGSYDLHGCDSEEAEKVKASRIAVINEFTALKPATRDYLSTTTGNIPAQSNSIIAAMRALYLNKHGVNALRVANRNARTLLLDPKWIDTRLDEFTDLGLEPKRVAPAALTHPTITVEDKLKKIAELGLPAARILNGCPDLVRIGKAQIQERLDNLTDLGLDALKIAIAAPIILKYLPESFRTKFLLLETAFRYLGVPEPRARAVKFAEDWPSQFSNGPHRVRTLIRLGSAILPLSAVDAIEYSKTSALLVQDLRMTLGAYLTYQNTPETERPVLETIAQFCTFSRQTAKALGRARLQELIAEHPDDPIIQFHNKGKRAAASLLHIIR
jgi:hypothetical protein